MALSFEQSPAIFSSEGDSISWKQPWKSSYVTNWMGRHTLNPVGMANALNIELLANGTQLHKADWVP